MNNTILFAHDFSSSADNALKLTAQFANSTGHHLHIYHVISTSVMVDTINIVDYSADQEIENAQNKINKEIESIQIQYPDLKMSSAVDYGFLIPKMVDKVNELNPKILVLGVKRRTGFDKVIFGDVCAVLVDKINVPLLVIPENTEHFDVNLIAYAWDGQTKETQQLKVLNEFVSHSTIIKIVNVNHYDEEVLDRGKEFEGELQSVFQNQTVHLVQKLGLDEEATMEQALNDLHPDLLVVYAHHYSFWQSLFHKSFSKQAISFSKAPVLVVH